jgi:hypothetical protein
MATKIHIRIYHPMMRLRSNWRMLTNAELRLLMAGLADWERRSDLGPVRSRIRRMRLDAVQHYRKVYGPLSDDRLWVAERQPNERKKTLHRNRHNPKNEKHIGVLWHEA